VWYGAGPLQALSAHLPAENSAQAAHTEEILKQLRQMQEQVSPLCFQFSPKSILVSVYPSDLTACFVDFFVLPAHLVHSPALVRPEHACVYHTCLHRLVVSHFHVTKLTSSDLI